MYSVGLWRGHSRLKLILFCSWLTICAVLFWTTYRKFKYSPEYYYVHQILGTWLCISRGSADVLNLNCGLLLLPMCRDLTMAFRRFGRYAHIRSISRLVDASKGFHISCAYLILILSGVHFIGHIFNACNFVRRYNKQFPDLNPLSSEENSPVWIFFGTVPGLSGLLMVLILCIIGVCSLKPVRRKHFNTFWYTHRLYVAFYLLLLVHAYRGPIKKQTNMEGHTPGCNSSLPQPEYTLDIPYRCDEDPKFEAIGCRSWVWIGPFIVVYLLCKLYQFTKEIRKAEIINFRKLPQNIVELCIERLNFRHQPGQYIYLMVPAISTTEWHPFSVSCITKSNSDTFNIHIQVAGDWTESFSYYLQTLHNDVEDNGTTEPSDIVYTCSIPVHIDGPFISPLGDVLSYPVSVCIAGGIGITPFISSLNYLRSVKSQKKISRLYVIWISRHTSSFTWFENVFEDLHNYLYNINCPDMLDTRFHVTSEQEVHTEVGNYVSRRLHYGRPIWSDLIGDIIKLYKICKVGVFVCGPNALTQDVKKTCHKLQTSSRSIHFHKESFE